MKIVVLIACSSNSKTIKDTLRSLSGCTIPQELDKIIVVENGDDKKLEYIVSDFENKIPIHYCFTREKGKSIALNIAIESGVPNDCFILFSDDDIRFNSDWMIHYRKAFHQYGKGYFFGAAFGVEYEHPPRPDLVPFLPFSAKGIDESVYRAAPETTFHGCNWAAYKEDLVEAGLFNPDFGPGSRTGATGQETEMQNRLKKRGIKPVFITGNLVWHKVPVEKCTFEWIRERTKRVAIEQFYGKNKRLLWLMVQVRNVLVSGLMSLNGNKKQHYRFLLSGVAIKSFVAQVFK